MVCGWRFHEYAHGTMNAALALIKST
jgi:hypothetical protein